MIYEFSLLGFIKSFLVLIYYMIFRSKNYVFFYCTLEIFHYIESSIRKNTW